MTTSNSTEKRIAEIVQKACIEAARSGFTDASISGLCTEGAMEAAISAIQMLDLEKLLKRNTPKS